MKFIRNSKELDEFSLNTNDRPARYPVVGWLEEIADLMDISKFKEVPHHLKLRKEQLIWFNGFAEGKGK